MHIEVWLSHNGNGCYIFSTWDWLPRFMWFFPCYMRHNSEWLRWAKESKHESEKNSRPASEQRKDMLAALVKEFEAGNSCRVSRWLTTGVVVVVTIYFLVGWTSPIGACHQISRAWASTIQYPHLSLRMVVSSPAKKMMFMEEICSRPKLFFFSLGFVWAWGISSIG